ncbi:MAG: SDR family NAD(P)-dependent oxidoreductase [Myxococcaceae bacterium]
MTLSPLPLAGRVALVTGASRGIGRAIAHTLVEAGADLVACSTGPGGCEEVERFAAKHGRSVLALAGDIALPQTAGDWVKAALKRFSRVDILVNNAGVAPRETLAEMTEVTFERTLAINLTGPFRLCRELVPRMVQSGFGRIVNVSSISGTLGTARMTAYCASKWGLNGFTKALAEEVRGSGVFVAAVLPGSTDTDMLRGSGFAAAMTPADVAGVVRYLCTEAPAQMSGSLVEVFG